MKKITKVLGVLAFAAGLLASCTQKDIEVPYNQLVGITADNAYFTDNAAQVKILLPSKAASPVTVNLGTYETTPTFGTQLPASTLSIPGSVVIAAGDSVATANITVDPSSLEKGKYQAVVAITGSDGADVRANNSYVTLNLIHGDLRPHVTLDADIEDYMGDEATVTITLSTPTETPATVTLAVSSMSEVPAAALVFEPTVQLAANKKSATVDVSIDRHPYHRR